MRKNNRIMIGGNASTKLCGGYQDDMFEVEPVVYTGLKEEKNVLFFSDEFKDSTINNLIVNIEQIRQSGSYSELDLYFSSNGGSADELFKLADYFNNISNLNINIIVNGVVASAGFLILLMIKNPLINIIFSQTSCGLIHLGGHYTHTSTIKRNKNDRRNDFDVFFLHELEDNLNSYIMDIYKKLDLSEEDLESIDNGKDVLVGYSELERIVNNYRDLVYAEEFGADDLIQLEEDINELEEGIKEAKKVIKEKKEQVESLKSILKK